MHFLERNILFKTKIRVFNRVFMLLIEHNKFKRINNFRFEAEYAKKNY